MKETKYRDCHIGKEVSTLKLIYLPTGGLSYNPVVKVRIMKWHTKPTTLLEKLFELPRFLLDSYTWDPIFTDIPLEEYCIGKCSQRVEQKTKIDKAEIEWSRI